MTEQADNEKRIVIFGVLIVFSNTLVLIEKTFLFQLRVITYEPEQYYGDKKVLGDSSYE